MTTTINITPSTEHHVAIITTEEHRNEHGNPYLNTWVDILVKGSPVRQTVAFQTRTVTVVEVPTHAVDVIEAIEMGDLEAAKRLMQLALLAPDPT